jgi:predicted nucleotidyltransferase
MMKRPASVTERTIVAPFAPSRLVTWLPPQSELWYFGALGFVAEDEAVRRFAGVRRIIAKGEGDRSPGNDFSRFVVISRAVSVIVVQKPAEWTLAALGERLTPSLERAGALRAIAFGSHARATADGFSDLDLVVILPTTVPRFERPRLLDEVYKAIPLGLDLLVLTPEEFDVGCRDRIGVFDAIVREGVTIYERRRDAT